MKKIVIFDLNGVLIVSPKLSERVAAECGIPEDVFLEALNQVMARARLPDAPGLYELWKSYFDKWNFKMSGQEFEDFWFNAEKENVPMTDLCRELRGRNVKLFVLSNNLRERSVYYDQHFPFLRELFEKLYYSWQTGFIKPDTKAFELILKENNLKPDDCIYFDDGQKNVDLGNSLGLESHLYENPAQVRTILNV